MERATSSREERVHGGDALALRCSSDVRGRLHAQSRDPARDDVLKEVAVIARDLHDA